LNNLGADICGHHRRADAGLGPCAAASGGASPMRVDQFAFALPEELIALRPAKPRDMARMLVVGSNRTLTDHRVRDLPHWLEPGDALVVNDTRVIAAQLTGHRLRADHTARVEATLHKRVGDNSWRAFVRGQKKLAPGDRIRFGSGVPQSTGATIAVEAEVREKFDGGEVLLAFDLSGSKLDDAMQTIGRPPLPPYIASRRHEDESDRQDYQTLFATHAGAVAAPTAGLHFTPGLLAALRARDIELCRVTLHVGAGTFLPVKVADTADHRMHSEWGSLDESTAAKLNAVRRRGGRIVAVGSTSLRLLESASDAGGMIRPVAHETALFITPGYRFKAVDILLTNFHLPRSTLFMLVAAFAELATVKAAYAHAVAQGYRFYSYGDACLLFGGNAGS
jgi:S-adenosylmethionine:tRNA ribosyltransferase-isomerase